MKLLLKIGFAFGIGVAILFGLAYHPSSEDPKIHSYLQDEESEEKMWAIVTTKEDKIEKIRVPIPKPEAGEVLVRVKYAPINPSDVYFALGTYVTPNSPPKVLPHLNGLEGSGQVIGSGGGLLPYLYTKLGTRVGFAVGSAGSWAEYVAVNSLEVVPLPSDVDYKHGSSSVVNPVTVVGFLEVAKEGGHHTLVHTAANSALGLMLLRAAPKYNISIICVVRGEKNEKILIDDVHHPRELVLRSDTEGFESRLQKVVKERGATLAFDAIGGKFSTTIYNAMPPVSETFVYGALSGEPIGEMEWKPRTEDKSLRFFHVKAWLDLGGNSRTISAISTVRSMLANELRTDFKEENVLDFEDGENVLDRIYEYFRHQKGGKMVIQISKD